MAELVVLRNPFDRSERDVRTVLADGQSTVAALVREYIPAGVDVNVSINGHALAREAWPAYNLAPHDEMVVMPCVGKGNSLLGAVLMIALVVSTGGIGAAIAGEGMLGLGAATMGLGLTTATWGMVIGAGVGLVGGMAVGSLIDAGIDVKADLAISQNLHQLEGALE